MRRWMVMAAVDMKVFVHVVRPDGRHIGADFEPDLPTTKWPATGFVPEGAFPIAVPTDAAPGRYQIWIGVFSSEGRIDPEETRRRHPPTDHWQMKEHTMKSTRAHRLTLSTSILLTHCIVLLQASAQDSPPVSRPQVDPFPATYADPAVPLLQLPTGFRSQRTTANVSAEAGKPVEILNVKGAGCVRHVWFVFGEKNLDDVEIEITVDDAPEPQVRMPFRSFLGVLLGFDDYHINSAGLTIFPNFTVTNDPLIPPKASPGWNFYLPIPFSSGCRITLHCASAKNGAAMVDWQQYREGVELTPLRFHAQRNIAQPGSPSDPFPIAETEGSGFLAGYIMGWRQKDHGDMVFHNSGTRLLIDGQTDPHVICGHNVEDDFGFSWGFNQYQTRWTGCPYRDNRGRNRSGWCLLPVLRPRSDSVSLVADLHLERAPRRLRSGLVFLQGARIEGSAGGQPGKMDGCRTV